MYLKAQHETRNPELLELVREVSGGCSLLFVGAGGVGKTRLLGLVREVLLGSEACREARQGLKVAWLSGEEWRVGSLVELLLRVLGGLVVQHRNEDLSAKVDSLYYEYRQDHTKALSLAKGVLTEFVGSASLLLLCDDLDELLDGLGDEGQRQWAELMREPPGWVILGTASSVLAGPVTGFFASRALPSLGVLGALELLRTQAVHHQDGALLSALGTPEGQASIAAVHHLLGGSHRVYGALYEGLRRAGVHSLLEPFLEVLRALSLAQEAQLWRLSPLQRKIVALLCEEACPVTVTRVAERCLSSHQSVAKQLGELALLGFLQKTPVGREVYCELASPSLRLYLDAKYHRAAYLAGCLSFLQLWFYERAMASPKAPEWPAPGVPVGELEKTIQVAARLVDEQGSEEDFVALASAQWSAGRSKPSLRTLIRGLIFHNSEALFGLLRSTLFSPEAVLTELDSMSEFAKRSSRLWELRGTLLLRLGRFEEAIQNSEQLLETNPEHRALSWLQVRALLGRGTPEEALRLLSELLSLTTKALERETIEHLREIILVELEQRGPMIAASVGVAVSKLFESQQRRHLAGGLLTALLKEFLCMGVFAGEAWGAAIILWREAYQGLDDCAIPLQLMQAAHRHLFLRDPAALLALPLEQRALLLGVFAEQERQARVQESSTSQT